MFIGAHEAEYMFVTTLLKIEQHLLAQGRCPYKLFRIYAVLSPSCCILKSGVAENVRNTQVRFKWIE